MNAYSSVSFLPSVSFHFQPENRPTPILGTGDHLFLELWVGLLAQIQGLPVSLRRGRSLRRFSTPLGTPLGTSRGRSVEGSSFNVPRAAPSSVSAKRSRKRSGWELLLISLKHLHLHIWCKSGMMERPCLNATCHTEAWEKRCKTGITQCGLNTKQVLRFQTLKFQVQKSWSASALYCSTTSSNSKQSETL